MKRDAEKHLQTWKNQEERYPLLIRGARQVGKSYLVESFGKQYFNNTVVVNFEFQPQLKDCFKTLDPKEIINNIQLILGTEINEKDTLLFLDEIQECPKAIMALRYFKEKMPGQAVVGAGSLLEFALQSENFQMPVGRIQFLYLEPFSFMEFLEASGNQKLREYLSTVQLKDEIDDTIHQKLFDLMRKYLVLGGMPAILTEYFKDQNISICQNFQNALLQTFRNDFAKYARTSQHKYLLKVFDAVPRLIGQRIKYVNIDPDIKSRDLKNALEMLILAGIVQPIYMSHASGLPLGAQVNERKLKVIFLDIGLMQNVCGLQSQISIEKELAQINAGAVAEQFAGQELLAYANKYQRAQLFFWCKDKRGSQAEVDYIIAIDNNIYPIEVKAGKAGAMKSLRSFMREKKSKLGIRISQEKLSYYDNILSLPFYMIEQVERLIKSI